MLGVALAGEPRWLAKASALTVRMPLSGCPGDTLRMEVEAIVGRRTRPVPPRALTLEATGGRLTADGFVIEADPRKTWKTPPKLRIGLAAAPALRWERDILLSYDCAYQADFRGRDGRPGVPGPAGRDGAAGLPGGIGVRGGPGEAGVVAPDLWVRVTRAEQGDVLQVAVEASDGRGGAWAIGPGGRLLLRVDGGAGGAGGPGGDGGRGGAGETRGGDGGAGGDGGNGANGGRVRIFADAAAYEGARSRVVVENRGGPGGPGGPGGAGGPPGKLKRKLGTPGIAGNAGRDGHGAADGPPVTLGVAVGEPLW